MIELAKRKSRFGVITTLKEKRTEFVVYRRVGSFKRGRLHPSSGHISMYAGSVQRLTCRSASQYRRCVRIAANAQKPWREFICSGRAAKEAKERCLCETA